MDGQQFDRIIRALGQGATRRGVFGILGGFGALGIEEVLAKRRNHKQHERKHDRRQHDRRKKRRGKHQGSKPKCVKLGQDCTAGRCCGELVCGPDSRCAASTVPCAGEGQLCSASVPCCRNLTCVNGTCLASATCDPGWVKCGAACVNPQTDPTNCGGCGVQCSSGVCSGSVCQAPSCTDKVKNGTETDVDCGGTCAPCVNGKGCESGSDCRSGFCSGGMCQACSTATDCASGQTCIGGDCFRRCSLLPDETPCLEGTGGCGTQHFCAQTTSDPTVFVCVSYVLGFPPCNDPNANACQEFEQGQNFPDPLVCIDTSPAFCGGNGDLCAARGTL